MDSTSRNLRATAHVIIAKFGLGALLIIGVLFMIAVKL
jgi:hypothetical protein